MCPYVEVVQFTCPLFDKHSRVEKLDLVQSLIMRLAVMPVLKLGFTVAVLYFSIKCFVKFLNRETGTRVQFLHSSDVMFPDVTTCWVLGYKKNVVTSYGFRREAILFDEGDLKSIANLIMFMNESRFDLEEFVDNVTVVTDFPVNGSYKNVVWSSLKDGSWPVSWKLVALKKEGLCYTLSIDSKFTQAGILQIGFIFTSNPDFAMENGVDFRDHGWNLILHTPGQLHDGKSHILQLQGKTNFVTSYDVEHALYMRNNQSSPCDYMMNDGYDSCWIQELQRGMIGKIGCYFPWHKSNLTSNHSELVCQNGSQYLNGGIENEVRSELRDSRGPHPCGNPCHFLTFNARVPIENRYNNLDGSRVKDNGRIVINFNREIAVTEEYFIYDFLSMMGEAGGYLGLFLGISFYEMCLIISDWKLRRKEGKTCDALCFKSKSNQIMTVQPFHTNFQ